MAFRTLMLIAGVVWVGAGVGMLVSPAVEFSRGSTTWAGALFAVFGLASLVENFRDGDRSRWNSPARRRAGVGGHKLLALGAVMSAVVAVGGVWLISDGRPAMICLGIGVLGVLAVMVPATLVGWAESRR